LTLPIIGKYRDEDWIDRQYEAVRPRVLGALLDAVSAGLRNVRKVKIDTSSVRMPDFARWITACEPALGWQPGSFLSSYIQNRATANSAALEAAVIHAPLLLLLDKREDEETPWPWSLTAGELLRGLARVATDDAKRSRSWPQTARGLSGQLRRISPNLRKDGIHVKFTEQWTPHGKLIEIRRTAHETVATVGPLPTQQNEGGSSNRRATVATVRNGPKSSTVAKKARKTQRT
jgi:hypothetical protein